MLGAIHIPHPLILRVPPAADALSIFCGEIPAENPWVEGFSLVSWQTLKSLQPALSLQGPGF